MAPAKKKARRTSVRVEVHIQESMEVEQHVNVKVNVGPTRKSKKITVPVKKRSCKAKKKKSAHVEENFVHVKFEEDESHDKDAFRVTVEKMLLKYIRGDDLPELVTPEGSLDPVKLADELETEIFNHAWRESSSDAYYYYARSRSYNISDPTNPKLRNAFLLGSITPAQLAVMPSEDMASDELKAQRLIWWNEGIEESQLPSRPESTTSSILKCIRCSIRDVGYYQLQTRSADEPMTTFAECYSCGKRWRF